MGLLSHIPLVHLKGTSAFMQAAAGVVPLTMSCPLTLKHPSLSSPPDICPSVGQ